jgi:nucleotide-binding universal stress UspA family protein
MMSSYCQLLVHIDDTQRTAMRLSLARGTAAEQGAAVAALYATRPAYEIELLGSEPPAAILNELAQLDEERVHTARRCFDIVVGSEPGPQVSWSCARQGGLVNAFVQQALHADLLVLGQRDPDDPQALDLPPDFVPSVVIDSGKPALVVPYVADVRRFSTVAIAWKPTREAARAVCGAMPLLQRAQKVVVLAWGDKVERANGACLDLPGYLHKHGVEAELHYQGPDEPPRLGELLLSRVCDFAADLLVMGCYGHSRAREWVLGGTTRTVLESMTVPVLVAH